MILQLHSYWAYIALLILIIAVGVFKWNWFTNKPYKMTHQRLALFTLIVYHIQLLIGFAWYFMSPPYQHIKQFGMGATMKESHYRMLAIEHPIMMILAIVLITMGYSLHKKKSNDRSKFFTLALFYGIALLLILLRIPYNQWFN
jgi:membrane protein YdbS with pleckstrin-like domain